jgi:hypothetical protein
MELKIVKRPAFKDESGKNWCVETAMYREGDGGMSLWFQKIEKVNPEIVYLYEIKSWKAKIANGINEADWFEDTIYSVRYAFKKTLNV